MILNSLTESIAESSKAVTVHSRIDPRDRRTDMEVGASLTAGRSHGQPPEQNQVGNVWVTNIGSRRIEKFSPDGTYLATFGSYGSTEESLMMPRQTAVDAEGRVFVAAGENPRVLVYGPDGSVIASWGDRGSGPGEFRIVQGIVLDGRGNVYVGDSADDRVQKFRLLPPLLNELPPA